MHLYLFLANLEDGSCYLARGRALRFLYSKRKAALEQQIGIGGSGERSFSCIKSSQILNTRCALIRHHLGGRLPQSVEIRCPTLDTRIKLDIPSIDGIDIRRAYAIFDRANLLSLCERRLRNTQDYHEVMGRELSKGARLEFAWSFETYLDWVWQLEDVQEKPRQWAVLYGLAMKQVGEPFSRICETHFDDCE